MPLIKFIRDVPNPEGGLLYAEGYAADVSDATAQKWIKSGDAVDPARLAASIITDEVIKPGQPEIEPEPPARQKFFRKTADPSPELSPPPANDQVSDLASDEVVIDPPITEDVTE